MNWVKFGKYFLVICLSITLLPLSGWGGEKFPHPTTYLPKANETKKILGMVDDPRDLMATSSPKASMPPEIWEYLLIDVEKAKKLNAELVGFKSTDVVGKIAPEIKPGKYTYKDLEKYPGFKDLFPPELQIHVRAAGPPLICSVEEFEIIPTTQIYWFPRYSETTKRNLGKTKLDKDGYIVPLSWEGGCPFPRPSGKLKAQQLYYSFEKRPGTYDFCYSISGESLALDRNLVVDKYAQYDSTYIRLMGRTLFPPFGWFDKRAERNGETWSNGVVVYEPRANRGTVTLRYFYDDIDKMDSFMIYVPSLRRIRKMTATDTQDPRGDMAYDDVNHLQQKITPDRFPYKFDIIAEREYLLPIAVNTAKVWVDSKNGYKLREVQMMRRFCYVLQMTQMDPNYLYSKRIFYVDKENFQCQCSSNYDQKGRLYRSQLYTQVWMPEIGQLNPFGTQTIQFDYVDEHSSFQVQFSLPAPFERKDFSMQEMIRKGK
ncbi:MAG: outer membrane lipoprotein-sorting protein [Deltaproteobacteria bacterium]|nr:outer membrane lipoprotein-sorting protein [Deltaproteobacteria bacterium]